MTVTGSTPPIPANPLAALAKGDRVTVLDGDVPVDVYVVRGVVDHGRSLSIAEPWGATLYSVADGQARGEGRGTRRIRLYAEGDEGRIRLGGEVRDAEERAVMASRDAVAVRAKVRWARMNLAQYEATLPAAEQAEREAAAAVAEARARLAAIGGGT